MVIHITYLYSDNLGSSSSQYTAFNFQDRLNEIRRMINKEKGVRPTVISEPVPQEPEQGTSGVISERGSIN